MKLAKLFCFLLLGSAGLAHADPQGPRFTYIASAPNGGILWIAPQAVSCGACTFAAPIADAATNNSIDWLRGILKFSHTGRINDAFYPAVGDVVNFCTSQHCRDYRILSDGNYESVSALKNAPTEFAGYWPEPPTPPGGGDNPPGPSNPPTCIPSRIHDCSVE